MYSSINEKRGLLEEVLLMDKKEFGDDTKLAKIRNAMEVGDWDLALRIAASFNRLGEHKIKITRAAESISNPDIYIQMGFDLEELKNQGILALQERFSKSWEIVNKRKG